MLAANSRRLKNQICLKVCPDVLSVRLCCSKYCGGCRLSIFSNSLVVFCTDARNFHPLTPAHQKTKFPSCYHKTEPPPIHLTFPPSFTGPRTRPSLLRTAELFTSRRLSTGRCKSFALACSLKDCSLIRIRKGNNHKCLMMPWQGCPELEG